MFIYFSQHSTRMKLFATIYIIIFKLSNSVRNLMLVFRHTVYDIQFLLEALQQTTNYKSNTFYIINVNITRTHAHTHTQNVSLDCVTLN